MASRKPSIAVLPFANLSQEPDTDYFSYGLTEDVIRLLARNRWLDVLSRHSAVAFQGGGTDPREIGAALGIRYLVQGTVVKHGERVRITADLVSAETGHHLWWESDDAPLADILNVQKAMAQQIAAVIEPELARLEREAAVRRPPVNLGAWDCYQRGLWHLWGFTSPALPRVKRCSAARSIWIPASRGRMAPWPMSRCRAWCAATPMSGPLCWRMRCDAAGRRSRSTIRTA